MINIQTVVRIIESLIYCKSVTVCHVTAMHLKRPRLFASIWTSRMRE